MSEEMLAPWTPEAEADEIQLRELEDREIGYWARFREVFRNEPTLIARLDKPQRWEDMILRRREERAARRRVQAEAWARIAVREEASAGAAPGDQVPAACTARRDELAASQTEVRNESAEERRVDRLEAAVSELAVRIARLEDAASG